MAFATVSRKRDSSGPSLRLAFVSTLLTQLCWSQQCCLHRGGPERCGIASSTLLDALLAMTEGVAAVGFDSRYVVNVEEAAAGASEVLLFRARGLLREAGRGAEVRPRSDVAVDVVEIRAALFEIVREAHGLAALSDGLSYGFAV